MVNVTSLILKELAFFVYLIYLSDRANSSWLSRLGKNAFKPERGVEGYVNMTHRPGEHGEIYKTYYYYYYYLLHIPPISTPSGAILALSPLSSLEDTLPVPLA